MFFPLFFLVYRIRRFRCSKSHRLIAKALQLRAERCLVCITKWRNWQRSSLKQKIGGLSPTHFLLEPWAYSSHPALIFDEAWYFNVCSAGKCTRTKRLSKVWSCVSVCALPVQSNSLSVSLRIMHSSLGWIIASPLFYLYIIHIVSLVSVIVSVLWSLCTRTH